MLNKPQIWLSVSALCLFGVVLKEFWHHPEWLGQFDRNRQPPNQLSNQTSGPSNLTLDQQGQLADIDNSAFLKANFNIGSGIPAPQTESSDSFLSVLQGLERSDSMLQLRLPEDTEGPFESYLRRYEFINPAFMTSPTPHTGTASGVSGGSKALETTDPASISLGSPLDEALQRQLATPAANANHESTTPGGVPLSGAPLPQGSLPGSDIRFNLSAPQMSPPPGTTGYIPPTVTPVETAPGAAIAPATPSVPAPNLAVPRGSQPATTLYSVPSISPPISGTEYRSPVIEIESEPFAVPRPPGSYTGGGYINTFSDPAGYID